MHWNRVRYCIGFPPDFCYDIADAVGIVVLDEFPGRHLILSLEQGACLEESRHAELVFMQQRVESSGIVRDGDGRAHDLNYLYVYRTCIYTSIDSFRV
ncbi:MAG: hypothetical protein U5R06_12255 [candidate division KSB1 bacterium]|nr:hypothetical protein [candidate division KSB1 bacterium]